MILNPNMLRLANIDVHFDLLDALKTLAKIHPACGVSVHLKDTGYISIRLEANNHCVQKLFALDDMRGAKVSILVETFNKMIKELKEYPQ